MEKHKKNNYMVASACLCGFKCRYNGKSKDNSKLIGLMKKGLLIPICPEVMMGLSTPRPAASVIGDRIIENDTKKDVTKIYNEAALVALKTCKALDVKKAYLKKNSPTCGSNGCFAIALKKNNITTVFTDTNMEG